MKFNENEYANVEVQDGEFKQMVAGGYVVRITEVEDNQEKEYLKVVYDIADGAFKGFYSDDYYTDKDYAHRMFRSYKESARGMFKQFYTAVEKSNAGYTFKGDENTLVGKLVGIVLSEEEYESNNGDIKTKLVVKYVKTVEDIRKGNYTVPSCKKLPQTVASDTGFMKIPDGVEDEGLPFN